MAVTWVSTAGQRDGANRVSVHVGAAATEADGDPPPGV